MCIYIYVFQNDRLSQNSIFNREGLTIGATYGNQKRSVVVMKSRSASMNKNKMKTGVASIRKSEQAVQCGNIVDVIRNVPLSGESERRRERQEKEKRLYRHPSSFDPSGEITRGKLKYVLTTIGRRVWLFRRWFDYYISILPTRVRIHTYDMRRGWSGQMGEVKNLGPIKLQYT